MFFFFLPTGKFISQKFLDLEIEASSKPICISCSELIQTHFCFSRLMKEFDHLQKFEPKQGILRFTHNTIIAGFENDLKRNNFGWGHLSVLMA